MSGVIKKEIDLESVKAELATAGAVIEMIVAVIDEAGRFYTIEQLQDLQEKFCSLTSSVTYAEASVQHEQFELEYQLEGLTVETDNA